MNFREILEKAADESVKRHASYSELAIRHAFFDGARFYSNWIASQTPPKPEPTPTPETER